MKLSINKMLLIMSALILKHSLLFSQNINTNILKEQFGVCSHVTRPSIDWNVRDTIFKIAKNIGVNYIRTDFDYTSTTHRNGVFVSDIFDAIQKLSANNNIKILGILDRKTTDYAWNDTTSYYDYVESLAKRYKGKIKDWEVINEIDLIKSNNLEKNYANILNRVFSILKTVDKENQVLLSGFASLKSSLFKEIAKNGALANCDAINFHFYSEPENIISQLDFANQVKNEQNINIPIWLTETGYHTAYDPYTNDYFFQEILPQSLKILNINGEIGIIYDIDKQYFSMNDDEIDDLLSNYKKEKITLESISKINPKKIPVIVVSSCEKFPMSYFHNIVEYVKKGGTIALAQGMPFYYNCDNGANISVGMKYYQDLHMSSLLWWTDDAKKIGAVEIPQWQKCSNAFSSSKKWRFEKWCSARYLTETNLKNNDELIPLVIAGTENFQGFVAAIYKLNSDLKGNIVVSTRLDSHPYVNREREQARRVARAHLISFSYGVDKVFWYNMRALEKDTAYSEDNYGLLHSDFSHKLAYTAYNTLTTMLPNESTRPILKIENNIYYCTWQRPDNATITAIWTPDTPKRITVNLDRRRVYNYLGNDITKIAKRNLVASQDVIYIVNR